MNRTVQIQSVLQNNDKRALRSALDSLSGAVSVNKSTDAEVDRVTVCYGDISASEIFSRDEVSEIKKCYCEVFDFEYKFFGGNTSPSEAHNILAGSCSSDYMMIMEPEAVVCPKVLEKLGFPLFSDNGNTVGMTEARQTPAEHPKRYNRETLETGWATTVCAMLRTDDFRRLDGFDSDSFPFYCSDVDFSWRLRLTGKKILYIPDCPVFFHSLSDLQKTDKYRYALEALLMAYKWCADSRLEQLECNYRTGGDNSELKALETFEKVSAEGKLPKKTDKGHSVSEFSGDYYARYRYAL